MSLPLHLDVPFDGLPSVVNVPFHGALIHMHAVSDLAIGHAVNHPALQGFPVPGIVAPLVNAVGDFRVGRHSFHLIRQRRIS